MSSSTLGNLRPLKNPPKYQQRKRMGRFSKFEEDLVEGVVANNPGPLSPRQVNALAVVLKRPKDLTKEEVEKARAAFASAAGDYVAIHKAAASGALADGEYEAAAKAAQWALQNITVDGARVVDKATAGEAGGTKIMIGIQMGGIAPAVSVEGD